MAERPVNRFDRLLAEVADIRQEVTEELDDLSTNRSDDLPQIKWGIIRLEALDEITDLIREKAEEFASNVEDEAMGEGKR